MTEDDVRRHIQASVLRVLESEKPTTELIAAAIERAVDECMPKLSIEVLEPTEDDKHTRLFRYRMIHETIELKS